MDLMPHFQELVQRLTLRQLLAQCVIVRVREGEYFAKSTYKQALHALVREDFIGGICVFGGRAVESAAMIHELQQVARASSGIPLLVAADFEYGVGMRLTGGTVFPHAMNIGAGNDVQSTRNIASAIALEARALGVHWNLAPVCDVNTNPLNPVIGIRSFGDEPELVARHCAAFIEGTQRHRVLACAKHFPGHGNTTIDSHESLPVLAQDLQALERTELLPFRTAIEAGAMTVMMGHIAVPRFETALESNCLDVPLEKSKGSRLLPASLSFALTTRLLRERLGFTGLIVTDALDMKAVTSRYDSDEAAAVAAAHAFAAGADVLLLPTHPFRALDALQEAVEQGRISRDKVYSSLHNVVRAKQWCGLLDALDEAPASVRTPRTQSYQAITADDTKNHQLLALDVAKKGLRWLPLRSSRKHEPQERCQEYEHKEYEYNEKQTAENSRGEIGKQRTEKPQCASSVIPLGQFRQIAAFAFVEHAPTLDNPRGDNQPAVADAVDKDVEAATSFFRYLAQQFHGDCDFGFVDASAGDDDVAVLRSGIDAAEAVVFLLLLRPQTLDAELTRNLEKDGARRELRHKQECVRERIHEIAQALSAGKKTLVVLCHAPQAYQDFPANEAVCAYSWSEPALGAVAAALVDSYVLFS